MYCSNCSCSNCKIERLTNNPTEKAVRDVMRLIVEAKDDGMTESELNRYSRPFRALNDVVKDSLIESFLNQGLIIEQTFEPQGRGRSRKAFVRVNSLL